MDAAPKVSVQIASLVKRDESSLQATSNDQGQNWSTRKQPGDGANELKNRTLIWAGAAQKPYEKH